jgi:hypothetical protein
MSLIAKLALDMILSQFHPPPILKICLLVEINTKAIYWMFCSDDAFGVILNESFISFSCTDINLNWTEVNVMSRVFSVL